MFHVSFKLTELIFIWFIGLKYYIILFILRLQIILILMCQYTKCFKMDGNSIHDTL